MTDPSETEEGAAFVNEPNDGDDNGNVVSVVKSPSTTSTTLASSGTNSNKKRTIWLAVFGVIAVVALALGLYFGITASNNNKAASSSSSDASTEDGTVDEGSQDSGGGADAGDGSGDNETAAVASGALIPGLIQTNLQPMFETLVPNALDPSFFYLFDETTNFVAVEVCKSTDHETGLVDDQKQPLKTPIYGFRGQGSDDNSCTWPGRTLEIRGNETFYVQWLNEIPIGEYLITSLDGVPVVDTSIRWAYSLPGYENYSIASDGLPVVVHHHGAHNFPASDGAAEAFFTPTFEITGLEWSGRIYEYREQVAAPRWYHDHTVGITRLNVYAGLAGFFFTRDDMDTGKPDNPLGLPAFPYEAAFAIQDRMFKEDGSLFYPAFPGDPAYEGFIIEQGAELPADVFPNGGPTALAEYFGDVIVVNGKIWPKMMVEPRNYRFRLLNGCDSRFLIVQFVQVGPRETEIPEDAAPLPFTVIGTDEGLAWEAATLDTLMIEPGARYDVIFGFEPLDGYRIVMRNIGLDEPFGGEFDPVPPPKSGTTYLRTDRIMAFDVVAALDVNVPESEFDPSVIQGTPLTDWLLPLEPSRTRRVGLFEGSDSFGRILPLLGTVDPATDCNGQPVLWPDTEEYQEAGLAGQQMQGTMGSHSPTTEHIQEGAVEEWEIWNFSEDAHPIHLHLASVEILGRYLIAWDSNTNEESRVLDPMLAKGDGTFILDQPVVMHDGSIGQGTRVMNATKGENVAALPGYFETGLKDTTTALPGQITIIKAYFDKAGTYAWHCHILSHEDADMMRRFTVCDGDGSVVSPQSIMGDEHY